MKALTIGELNAAHENLGMKVENPNYLASIRSALCRTISFSDELNLVWLVKRLQKGAR